MTGRGRRRVRLTRDATLFLAGLGLLGQQALLARPMHPELVAAAVALLLAPAATRTDDARRDGQQREGERDDEQAPR